MIKPESNAPSDMQPWVRTTDQQIADLEAQIARLETFINGNSRPDHEQNKGISDTFSFTTLADGTTIPSASAMKFTGKITAQDGIDSDKSVRIGSPDRQVYDDLGNPVGQVLNFEVISSQFGTNPVTGLDYYSDGKINSTDATFDLNGYGQIVGDGMTITLKNDGQNERANVAIISVNGTGTQATYQIENNANNVATYLAGRYVTISGIDPVGYNTDKSIILSVDNTSSPMTFTIESGEIGTYIGGGYVTINQPNSIFEGLVSVQGPGPLYNGVTISQNGAFVGQDGGDEITATASLTSTQVSAPSAVISGTRVFVSNNAPTAISDGDLWIDSSGKVPLSPVDIPTNYIAKNFIINGGMDIWQRGTSGFSTNSAYTADRWTAYASAGTFTVSQSTDVPAGVGVLNSLSFAATSATVPQIATILEARDSALFAGQQVTISVWAKSTVGTSPLALVTRVPSATDTWTTSANDISVTLAASMTVGSWTRYSATFTASTNAVRGYQIVIYRNVTTTSTTTLYTGIQLELGSTVSAFTRNSLSIQGELAACQRYYQKLFNEFDGTNFSVQFSTGYIVTSQAVNFGIVFPVKMRTVPTMSGYADIVLQKPGVGSYTITAMTAVCTTTSAGLATTTLSAGISGATAAQAIVVRTNSSSSYMAFSAEL